MFRRLFPLFALAAAGAGCAVPGLTGSTAAPEAPAVRTATAEAPVSHVATFWRAAEGVGPAGTPVRGFAGRVLLTTDGGKDPVVGDGAVRVYLFSDDGDRADRATPVNTLDLTAAQWRASLSVGNLGPAYDVFIAYPHAADHAVRCSLRVRFTPLLATEDGADPVPGRPLFSHAATCTLDGPPDPDRHARPTHVVKAETLRAPVRVTRHEEPREAAEPSRVVQASATAPGPDLDGLDKLSPESRARIERALADYNRRTAAGEVARA